MKTLAIILVFISQICIAQEIEIDSCGLNNSPKLNKYESAYFNQTIDNQRKRFDFNFNDKSIAFAYGNYGNGLITKDEYFEKWGRDYFIGNSSVYNQLFVLTAEEIKESGGFDAIIVSWSKIGLTKKHRKKLIKKIAAKK